MLRHLAARFVSWINGRTIGDVRYIKSLPFIIGNLCHFLPPDCWTAEERDSLRYCVIKQRWNGFDWEFVEELKVSRDELKRILETSQC